MPDYLKRIKELRVSKKLTQKDFSAMVGITGATLSAYENGTKAPTVTTAKRIAREFDVSLDWLCGLDSLEPRRKETPKDTILAVVKMINDGVLHIAQHGNAVCLVPNNSFQGLFRAYSEMSKLQSDRSISSDIFHAWLNWAVSALKASDDEEKKRVDSTQGC